MKEAPNESPSDLVLTLPEQWREVVGAYLGEVAEHSGSTRTPVEYARYLGAFFAGVGDPGSATAANVHTFAYRTGSSGRTPSASTVSVRLAAISSFYGFAVRTGLLASNPAANVRRPRSSQPTPRGLTAEEVCRLILATPVSPSGLRDRALIVTAVLTGLRRSELLGLRRGDLTVGDVVFYKARAKGGIERHRELPEPALHAIEAACEAIGKGLDTMAPDDLLFPVSGRGFAANLARYGARAGVGTFSPHVLRHTAAKLRRDVGASIEDVSALLGHRSLFTTARYLARLEGERDSGWRSVAMLLGVA
jgi:site-specific recombinase XerD